MSQVDFKLEGVNEAIIKFEELTLFTRQEVIRQTAKSTLKVEAEAKDKAAVDTGNLRAQIFSRFEDSGLTGIVFTSPKYAPFVEFGRPPGKQPPTEALEGWARRHNLQGLEFVIARAIGRRGLKPQPFMYPAFENERINYINQVKAIVKKLGDK